MVAQLLLHCDSFDSGQKIEGFTVLELVAVVFILTILASFSIPSLFKYTQESRISQAKSLLNAAASECLQMYRSEGIAALSRKPSILEREKLPNGYTYILGQDKCRAIAIEDLTDPASLLVTLGMTIDDASGAAKVAKWSVFKHPDTKYACEQWGGCGEGANVQAIIEEQNRRAQEQARQAAIEARYNAWLKGPPPGTGNYTQDGKDVWAFQGRILTDKAKYDEVVTVECGKEMTTALNNALANTDGPFSYIGQNGGCTINTYICSGKDVGSKDGYDACKERERQERCIAAEGRWKNSGINGKFEESGCEVKWRCGNAVLNSQADYDASSCGKTWKCTNVPQPCADKKYTRTVTPLCYSQGRAYICPPPYSENYTVCEPQPPKEQCGWIFN